MYSDKPKILVIRRDNIGDLVCTTPLIHALRERFPNAWLGALVNSYNAPVLDGNLDLDGVFVYTKAKHRNTDESLARILWQRWRMMRQLRAMHLDDVILATTVTQPRVMRIARWLKPKRIIAFDDRSADIELASQQSLHEVEDVFRIANVYGIDGAPPSTFIRATALRENNLVAIHVSARKPSQRWPAERFVELMHELHRRDAMLKFVLLWSPGASDDPRHPGDDEKARAIIDALGATFPVTPRATATLAQLIHQLSRCSTMICADGGAMHIGAGLGLPIVALFGDSSVARWRPWAVPQRVLQAPSRDVSAICVIEAADAFSALRTDTRAPNA